MITEKEYKDAQKIVDNYNIQQLNIGYVSHCDTDDEDTTVYLFEEVEESKTYSIFKGVVICFIAAYVGYIIFDTIKNSCG